MFKLCFSLFPLPGNKLNFTTTPRLERSATNTTIRGCQYTSAQGKDFSDYAYIKFNNTLYPSPVNSSSELSGDGELMLPTFTFPYYIEEGFFSCVIKIEDEMFESESSELYEKPGILSSYICTALSRLTLKGCVTALRPWVTNFSLTSCLRKFFR